MPPGSSLRRAGELLGKYAEILAMRLDDEAAQASAPADAAALRARMGALALKFPGALREIDRLELAEIRARIEKLERVVAGGAEVEPWMIAIALFHEFMRGALCAKQWLRGAKRVDDSDRRAFAEVAERSAFAAEAGAWVEHLGDVASPPEGRVTELVYSRIAGELGITPGEAKRLVFGVRRVPVSSTWTASST